MARIEESIVIGRSPTEVFDVAVDPLQQPAWDPAGMTRIEKLSAGPLGVGARYRGRFKGVGTVEYEFTEFEPGQRFAHRARVPIGTLDHRFMFESFGEGTRLTQEGTLTPNLLGRLLTPLLIPVFRRRFRTINTELRDHLTPGRGAAE